MVCAIFPSHVIILPSDTRLKVIKVNDMIVWSAAPKRGKPTVLYLHGNAGHIAKRTARLQRLMDRGYGIIAPSYPGANGSKALGNGQLTGTPTTPIIYGESIGAAVTLDLTASYLMDHGASPPRAVVLEAPFTSLKDVAAHIHPQLPLATGLMLSRWPSIDNVRLLKAPLLILHGEKDDFIPPKMGRAILEAAGSKQKELYVVKGAGHINMWTGDAQRRLYKFLNQF
ncbi:Protein bem46 [Nymphon striatum]|nr:Protein bem46 [Nymphon striatum]